MLKPLEQLPDDSRVWVYQADRRLDEKEIASINEVLSNFAANWQSHGHAVHAWAGLENGFHVIFAADEKASGVSGCSIDSSVACLREIGARFEINWFDRLTLAVEGKDGIFLLSRDDFASALSSGKISEQSTVYNNTITDLAGLRNNWRIPFAQSWAAAMAK